MAEAPGMAGSDASAEMNWLRMGMALFGGLAMFLYGLDKLADGLKALAGDKLKTLLEKLTRRRVMGALMGAFVTSILNSSSVTTVLVVGFVTAGVMTLSQSIGVIMGANIGSTVTAQIVAFNVTELSLGMVAVGFAMLFVSRRDGIQQSGAMLMGLGLVFFGMGVMGDAVKPLRSFEPFLDLMVRMENPLLGILVGALFTGLVQSSAATMSIAIVMALDGLISLPAAVALSLGANIGTCVTAGLAALGKPVEAVRAAAAHVAFNIVGVLLWVWFIPELIAITVEFSPPDLPRQIANANSLFNIINTVLFLPFAGLLATFLVRVIPDRAGPPEIIVAPKFLDGALVSAPSLALERVRDEIGHAGERVLGMFEAVRKSFTDVAELAEVSRTDDQINALRADILDYMGEIRQQTLSQRESDEFVQLMGVTHDLGGMGDVMRGSLGELARKFHHDRLPVSETMREALAILADEVTAAMEGALEAVVRQSEEAASNVLAKQALINDVIDRVLAHQAAMLAERGPQRLAVFRLEMQVVDDLKRLYTMSSGVAKTALPEQILAARVA
jgi:phosphate:Na+ symporter